MDPSARYDGIAGFYDGFVGDDVSDPPTAALLDLAPSLESARVLDLACGQGRVSRELARRGASVVGIDISDALLGIAREVEQRHPMSITYVPPLWPLWPRWTRPGGNDLDRGRGDGSSGFTGNNASAVRISGSTGRQSAVDRAGSLA